MFRIIMANFCITPGSSGASPRQRSIGKGLGELLGANPSRFLVDNLRVRLTYAVWPRPTFRFTVLTYFSVCRGQWFFLGFA